MKPQRSYFATLLSWFLIGTLVPVSTILVLNIQSLGVIREQTVLANQNTLQQAVRLMDYEVEKISHSCMEIANLSDVKRYISVSKEHPEEAAILRYTLKKKLAEYSSEDLKDVFIYYFEDDYVISGMNGALQLDYYYQSYYGMTEDIRSEFLANLTAAVGTPTMYVINPGGEERYLCITMRGRGNDRDAFVVSFLLQPDYLSTLSSNGGSLLLFDKNRQLLLSDSQICADFHMDDYSGSNAPYEASFAGQEYIMQVYHSEAIDCYFAFATPSAYFWNQLSWMRSFSILSIILCVTVSMALAWVAAKRNYKPVEEIMDTLHSQKESPDYKRLRTKEFDFIQDYFRNQAQNRRRLSRENTNNLRNRLIMQMLERNELREGDNAAVMERIGSKLLSDRFASGIIQIEHSNGWSHSELFFILSNVFEEIFNRADQGHLVYASEQRYAFLINLAVKTDMEKLATMLQEGKDFLKAELNLDMTIAYSNVQEGLQEIKHTYDQAKTALRYRYIFETNELIPYRILEERRFIYRSASQDNLYTWLSQYINQTGAQEEPEKTVERIFDGYTIGQEMSMETMECFKFDVINCILHIGLEYNLSSEVCQDKVKQLLRADTLSRFRRCLIQSVEELHRERLEQQESTGICANGRACIEQYYSDPQMSMAYISDHIGVSASYLSRQYKKEYGISVLQDITRVRLINAKKLLQDGKLSVAEISERTGFSNSNVFIKVFKKQEGMTPGQYKEMYRSKP